MIVFVVNRVTEMFDDSGLQIWFPCVHCVIQKHLCRISLGKIFNGKYINFECSRLQREKNVFDIRGCFGRNTLISVTLE